MGYSVFLSYRRAGTSGHAGRIGDDLERHFHRPIVFRDVESISAGVDFVDALEQAIVVARVAIVLIGDSWLSVTNNEGMRRLDDPNDHVRREVEMALQDAAVTVLPVLVEGAAMPDAQVLPEPLKPLARLQAIALSEERWDYDVMRLVKVLEGAGIPRGAVRVLPPWAKAAIAGLLTVMLGMAAWFWWPSASTIEDYTGVWYLPNGSHWTISMKDDGSLWVEETHHESKQVWKRGPGKVTDEGLLVQLELVFDRLGFHYRHKLRFSDDRDSLFVSTRRSDQSSEQSFVLSREKR